MERRLAAILAADVVGYSRLMGEDEAGAFAALKALRKEIFAPQVAEYHGRIFKLVGDGALVEFISVVDAVACAVSVQQMLAQRNAGASSGEPIELRIGINLGDIIIDGSDFYGDGVNVAARLQECAAPGGIVLSATAYEHTAAKIADVFEDGGELELKNIAKPVRVYHWARDATAVDANKLPPLHERPSIAVLPFTNMSGDPEQEYFSDGITEDIITELSRFRSLFVIARHSSFAYKGQSVKIRDIARDLNVTYVVEGSVRRAANQLRITAQLVEAEHGNHVWAARYDRDLEDVFVVQDEVTQAVVSSLAGRIEGVYIHRSKRKPTDSMTAYDFFLRGNVHRDRYTSTENSSARALYQKAIELDPDFCQAHAQLAFTHIFDFELGWSDNPDKSYALSLLCAQRAVEADNADARAHAALANTAAYGRRFDLCQTHLDKAYELNPNDADILARRSLNLCYLGHPEEAVEASERARRLNPFAPDWYRWNHGVALFTASRFEDAIAAWKQIADTPTDVLAELAAAYGLLGRLDDAEAYMAEYCARSSKENPNYPGDNCAEWRKFVSRAYPFKNASDLNRVLEGYRKAGLNV